MEYIGLILQCGFPILLIAVGLLAGSTVERRHLKRLDEREARLRGLLITDTQTLPPGLAVASGQMMTASVVIGSDYFKTVVAGLRKLVGGEIRSFERLMERARREAVCRLMEKARQANAAAVINLRLETASVGRMSKNPMPMVEVVAYGTIVMEQA